MARQCAGTGKCDRAGGRTGIDRTDSSRRFADSILEETAASGEPINALHDGIQEAKKVLIERAIEQADGNYTEAAKILGVHPNHLFRLIRTLKLKPKKDRKV